MDKAYTRVNYENTPSHETPLSATNLNIMDKGIDDLDDRIIALDGSKVDKYKDIPNPIDLNTLTETGFYFIHESCTNIPSGANGGGQATVQVISTHVSSSYGYIVQIFYNQLQVDNAQQVYFRIGYGTIESPTFLSWQIMAVSSDLKDIAQGIGNMWDLGSYANTSLLYSLGFPTHMYPAAQQGSNAYALDVLSGTVYKNTRMGETSYTWVEQTTLTLKVDGLESNKSASGSIITLSDACAMSVSECVVDIDAVQDLHGYDKPWVGGAGKNKLETILADIKTVNTDGTWSDNAYTLNNITFTVEVDGDENVVGIKVNGTASQETTFNVGLTPDTGTFAMNGCPDGGSVSTYSLYAKNLYVHDYGTGANITTSGTQVTVAIVIRNGYTANNLIFYPMVRASGDATFAPYTNICPISGFDAVNLQRNGVNQWDEETQQGYYNGTTGAYTSANNQLCSKNPIEVNPNTTYYFKLGSLGSVGGVLFYDENNTFISSVQAGANTFVTPNNCKYITLNFSGTYGTTYNHDISINYPSTDTQYHAYAGKTYTIQLGDTVYGGTLDVGKGLLTVTHEIENGGFTQINQNNGYKAYKRENMNYAKEQFGICNMISEYGSFSSGNMNKNIIQLPVSNQNCFVALDENYNIDEVYFTYELATPYTIQLTPQQIKLLENNNTLYANSGDIAIKYQPNNAVGKAIAQVDNRVSNDLGVRPALKSMSFNGTTNTNGNLAIGNYPKMVIISVEFTSNTGNPCGTPMKINNTIDLHIINGATNDKLTNTAVSGILYYYDL